MLYRDDIRILFPYSPLRTRNLWWVCGLVFFFLGGGGEGGGGGGWCLDWVLPPPSNSLY